MKSTFERRLGEAAAATDAALDRLLAGRAIPPEASRPARLVEAMRYAVLGGGKRLRPFLVIESAAIFACSGAAVVDAAAALECLHCYSLVHDDLPAMDDDDLRRGRKTVHRAYDEATAILAGDALLTLAFDILARLDAPAETVVALVRNLAAAAGVGGMAGGQMLDIAAEGRPLTEPEIVELQAMKTGALFRFATEAGAILAGASEADQDRLKRFGEAIGLAFQLADDLIDATGAVESAGKRTGKDAGRGKATLVALHGVGAARDRLAAAVAEAVALLSPYGERGEVLREVATFIAGRVG